ncbi:MAG: hypothetical protein AAGJ95_01545 [Cyanobacteria bacterium J06554_11]
MKKISTVFDLLKRIQHNPSRYLGYPSVHSLFIFLNGYRFARQDMGVDLTEQEAMFYSRFQPWLQEKLGVNVATSWPKLVMLSCKDEQAGFKTFFVLLAEFRHWCRSESALSSRSAVVHRLRDVLETDRLSMMD